MQAHKFSLPRIIVLVTLGAALGLVAATYFDARRGLPGQDDSETPLFI
ncbi:hypothetical protein [Deinococcus sp. Marseille-Q6407]|nr:hypothetical protein [Deinococcus sp. Marseille-Q6407]